MFCFRAAFAIRTTIAATAALLLLAAGEARAQFGPIGNGKIDPFNKNNITGGSIKIPGNSRPTFHGRVAVEPITMTGTVFSYSTGRFVVAGGGKWVEERNSGPNSNFTQITRNATYVELLDKDRNMRVRLYQDQGMFQDKTGRWFTWPGSAGSWGGNK